MSILLLCTNVCAAAEEPLRALYNPAYPAPVVEEHEPTGDEYFADAVFIGDSLMEYVELLDEIPTANFVWRIGMSIASSSRRQFKVKGSDQSYTTCQRAAMYNPRKLYVMLGSNGLDNFKWSAILNDYEKLADELITAFPDCLIYVISVPPMSKSRMTADGINRASRYSNFNASLKELAGRRNFYFIDFYSMLVNQDGYLPKEYNGGDGYHLSTIAYQMLLDQVRKQTVPYPTAENTKEGN